MTHPGGPDPDPDVFDLAEPPPPPPPVPAGRPARATAYPTPVPPEPATPPGAVPVLPYRPDVPDARRDAMGPEFDRPVIDLWLPVGLIAAAAGVLAHIGYANNSEVRVAVFVAGAYVLVKAVVVTVAVPVMTRVADVSFGRPAQGVLKLAAVGLFPDAMAGLVFTHADACSAVLLSIPVGVLVAWGMFAVLFGQDFAVAMWCTVILAVVTLVPYILWLTLWGKMMGAAGL